MKYGLKNSELETIVKAFRKFPQIEEAILFGSRAMERQKKGSDIDIALKGKNISSIIQDVSRVLNEETFLPYYFDVLDHESIESSELIDHIARIGIPIYHK